MELVFWLNRKYPPYFKWLHRAVAALPVLGARTGRAVQDLLAQSGIQGKLDIIEGLCTEVAAELARQDLSLGLGNFLCDHAPLVHEKISDPVLRANFPGGCLRHQGCLGSRRGCHA